MPTHSNTVGLPSRLIETLQDQILTAKITKSNTKDKFKALIEMGTENISGLMARAM